MWRAFGQALRAIEKDNQCDQEREGERERRGGGGGERGGRRGEGRERGGEGRDVQNRVRYKLFPPKNHSNNFGELITTYENNQLSIN